MDCLLPGLQGAVEPVGDGALEDRRGVSVEGLQTGGGHARVDLTGHAQVPFQRCGAAHDRLWHIPDQGRRAV